MTTSSTYWLCFFLGITPMQTLALKIAVAVLSLVLTILIIYNYWCLSQMNTMFCIAMCCAVCALCQIKSVMRVYSTLLLNYDDTWADYIGRELEQNESFKRFFNTSEAHHYEIASSQNIYTLLTVKCGRNIHEIHPASHCMRSAGWNIEREEVIEVKVNGRKFGVTEVEASHGASHRLLWVWYSTPENPTGNFLGFRRMWSVDAGWETYQLAVYHNGDVEKSREALIHFLENVQQCEDKTVAEGEN